MDSCDSAGRKNKTDGFSECFGTGADVCGRLTSVIIEYAF